MTPADLAAVAAIEAENPAPWSMGMLGGELGREDGWQWVAESADLPYQVCGFVCGRSCGDEAELFRIAVIGGLRRQGVARQLVEHAITQLAADGVSRCFLEVRASNVAALGLYNKTGFVQIGLRRGYYTDPSEDAIIMESVLVEGTVHEEHQGS